MTPAEIELLIRRILNEGVRLQSLVYVVLVGISTLGGLVGSFLTAYAKKRGENLATKTDFDELLRQLRLQTQETEKIKSEITRASWVHQQRWDFKREVYSQLLAILEEIRQKTFWLGESLRSADSVRRIEGLQLYGKHMFERGVLDKLLSYRGMAGMILDQKALDALDHLSLQFDQVAETVLGSGTIYEAEARLPWSLIQELATATKVAYDLVREAADKDLFVGGGVVSAP